MQAWHFNYFIHGLYILFAVVEIKCAVQCYAWGKIGLTSAVAQLAQHSPSFKLEEDRPYSEVLLVTAVGLIVFVLKSTKSCFQSSKHFIA